MLTSIWLFLSGMIIGAYAVCRYEAYRARRGKTVTFDGDVYLYVKVDEVQ